ncbi:MAG: Gfo/Idh/MocA family oxidoreductase [Phycisphaerae bacterium]|nr:Gfo/Idh/MocA family oxidoreductase [Phycisphaerae bacterium]
MSANQMTRRGFLAKTAGGAAALGTTAAMAQVASGANERLTIGIIGCGDRGTYLMNEIKKQAEAHNVVIAAVCDVWKVNLDAAAARVKEWFGTEPAKATRFQDVLAIKDIDAVVIATPDFMHTPILIEALQADKDAYVEKPMSLEVANANKALDLARARQRVVQVGTQRRSDGRFKAAAKLYATGVLGEVSRATAANNVNHPRWAREFDNCKAEDVDWDAYLAIRPKQPFDPRLLRRWHHYRLCTNGISGLWMAHFSDAVHMITGATYPTSAVAHGGVYVWKDGRETSDTFQAMVEYPEGFLMSFAMGLANAHPQFFSIHGTLGTLDMDAFKVSGAGGAGEKAIKEETKIKPEKNENHMGNWLECLRTREKPNADIQYGHQHAVATILAAAALHTGQRHVYDVAKREIRPG